MSASTSASDPAEWRESADTRKYEYLSKDRLTALWEVNATEDQLKISNTKAKTKLDEELKLLSTKIFDRARNLKKLRLVLFGKTGVGKSSFANLLLRTDEFEASNSSESCTKTIQRGTAVVDGIEIEVIDTPGFFDTKMEAKAISTELVKALDLFRDGIHGFLFVFNLQNYRFCEQEKQILKDMEEIICGKKFFQCCFVILTHGEVLMKDGKTLREYLNSKSEFTDLLKDRISERVIAVDNVHPLNYFKEEERKQVVRMIASKSSFIYTNEDIKKHWNARMKGIDPDMSELLATIEENLGQKFSCLTYKQLMEMSKVDRKRIVQKTTQEVRARLGKDVKEPVLQSITEKVADEKIGLYTNQTLLDKILAPFKWLYHKIVG